MAALCAVRRVFGKVLLWSAVSDSPWRLTHDLMDSKDQPDILDPSVPLGAVLDPEPLPQPSGPMPCMKPVQDNAGRSITRPTTLGYTSSKQAREASSSRDPLRGTKHVPTTLSLALHVSQLDSSPQFILTCAGGTCRRSFCQMSPLT